MSFFFFKKQLFFDFNEFQVYKAFLVKLERLSL